MGHEASLGGLLLWHPGIPHGGTAGEEAQRLRAKFNKFNSSKKKNRRTIDLICTRFSMSNKHKYDVINMVDKIVEAKYTKEKWVHMITAGCVYIIARLNELPLSMLDVADAFALPFFKVGAQIKEICADYNIALKNVDPAIFVDRYAFLLRETFSSDEECESIADAAARVARVATDEWMSIGRRATPVAASALRISAQAFGYNLSFEVLSELCGDGVPTLRARYNEMKVILINLSSILPWGDRSSTINEQNFENHLKFIVQHADALRDLRRSTSLQNSTKLEMDNSENNMGGKEKDQATTAAVAGQDSDGATDAKQQTALRSLAQPSSSISTSANNGSSVVASSPQIIILDDDDDDDGGQDEEIESSTAAPALDAFRKVSSIESMMTMRPDDLVAEMKHERLHQQSKSGLTRHALNYLKTNEMNAPISYIENHLKRKRRREKIEQAKLRIRSMLTGRPIPMTRTLDSEDLDIERMLLAGTDEHDIEQGYQPNNTIYANSLDESEELTTSDLLNEDESVYIRTPEEVHFYRTIGARFLQRDNPKGSSKQE